MTRANCHKIVDYTITVDTRSFNFRGYWHRERAYMAFYLIFPEAITSDSFLSSLFSQMLKATCPSFGIMDNKVAVITANRGCVLDNFETAEQVIFKEIEKALQKTFDTLRQL